MATRLVGADVCEVLLDGEPLPETDWSFDDATSILDVTYTMASGALAVNGC